MGNPKATKRAWDQALRHRLQNGVRSQARRRKGIPGVSRWPRQGGAECLTQAHCDRVTELWCQGHTRTESASLRYLVTGHAPFFSSACHLGLDARFGVQDLALRGEPPVESPALAPPAAGFFFGARALSPDRQILQVAFF